MNVTTLIPAFQLAIRAGLAAGLSVAIAIGLGLEFPLYAMIAVVIVIDLSPAQTRQLGIQRLAGTILGAGIGAVLSGLHIFSPWIIGLGIVVAMFLCHLLRLQSAAKVAGYVCGIVLLEHSAQPWIYAFYRLIETVLGIVVALAVSFIPKLIRLDAAISND